MTNVPYPPGPFYIQGPSTGIGPYDDGGDYAIYRLNKNGKKEVVGEAFRLIGEGGVEANAQANAQLWAAAEKLLTACEALVDALGDVLDAHAWPNCPDCRQGLAALEDGKATIAAARPATEPVVE